jgi:hypothetical protein
MGVLDDRCAPARCCGIGTVRPRQTSSSMLLLIDYIAYYYNGESNKNNITSSSILHKSYFEFVCDSALLQACILALNSDRRIAWG